MFTSKEIENLESVVDHLKERTVKSTYWEEEKKILKKTTTTTRKRIDLISVSAKKLQRTFSL